jgi:hypothetical protein
VTVLDAAGNSTAVTSASVTVPEDRVLDRGAANGTGAAETVRLSARWVETRDATLRRPFGRSHRVQGRLVTSAGKGIANAQIDVAALITSPGSRTIAKAPVITQPDGSWSVPLPSDVSSRDLTFGYRSHVNDRVPVAVARLRLRIAAGLTFQVRPRTSAVGSTITLSGRLLGRPIPQRGKILVLQARAPGGRWLPFATIRTTVAGAFRTRYVFRQPGAAIYQFRAVSPYEAAYPYTLAPSPAVSVRKRA